MASAEQIRPQVLQQVAAIPYGCVASYGQIAKLCGWPNHARLVGRLMKDLPETSQIPWHRVVNSQGRLSFPEYSEKWQQQKRLLEQEGVLFMAGKISMQAFAWQ